MDGRDRIDAASAAGPDASAEPVTADAATAAVATGHAGASASADASAPLDASAIMAVGGAGARAVGDDADCATPESSKAEASGPAFEDGPVTVHVRFSESDRVITLERVFASDRVRPIVTERLQEIGVLPMERSYLSIGDRGFNCHDSFAANGVLPGGVLYVELWEFDKIDEEAARADDKVDLSVKTLTGTVVQVTARSSDTTERLMMRLTGKTGIPPSQQRLILAGRQLDIGRSLSSYNITTGSTLHLVLRL